MSKKNPFVKLETVYHSGTNTCTINWELDGAYEDGRFLIRKSPDGERNIEIIKSDLPWTTDSFDDTNFFIGNRTGELYYQIILRHNAQAYYSGFVAAVGKKSHITPETLKIDEQHQEDVIDQKDDVLVTDERVEPSAPEQDLRPLNRELGIINQISKLELLNMRHRGTQCAILKPKKIGELSYQGVDQDTKQETNPYGEDRFGEMYVGGFTPPIYTYMMGMIQRIDLLKPYPTGEGETDKYIYKVRMVAQPRVAMDDVIVDLTDDSRYAVKQVDNYQLRGEYSIVMDLQIIMIPRNNVVYKFPVPKPFDPLLPPVMPDTPYDPDSPSGVSGQVSGVS